MSVMRAKMRVDKVERFEQGQPFESLTFRAVVAKDYDETGLDEDNTFSRFTPFAELKMSITNPALLGKFEAGQVFYVDFTEADQG